MLKKLLCAVLTPLTYCYNFDLCVVGATSGLGNELIYRCIKDAKKRFWLYHTAKIQRFVFHTEKILLIMQIPKNSKTTIY